jgi:5-methylcytosine-specific restriction endonuclease McrA
MSFDKPRPHVLVKADQRKVKDREDMTVRSRVRERDGFKCRACGKRCVDVHHLKLRSRGGANEASNLLCLCRLDHARVDGLTCAGWSRGGCQNGTSRNF